ncbi:MAG: hypothetical protein ABIJ57_02690 [Pseudomonadota bacterium]
MPNALHMRTKEEIAAIKRERQAELREAIRRRKAFDHGELVRVKFTGIIDPQVPLEFNFEGRNFGPYESGNVYEVPTNVVHHINSLEYPEYRDEVDTVTKMRRSVRTAGRQRFSMVPLAGTEPPVKPKQPEPVQPAAA